MGRPSKRWSYSAGERGRNRVRVYEDARSRSILMEVYEGGRRVRTSLGHPDRHRAKREADKAAAEFGSVAKLEADDLRVGQLFEKYLRGVTPGKTPHKQKHDRRTSQMFEEFLGPTRAAESLNRRDWDRSISDRLQGRITGRPVRRRAVEYDLRFLWQCFGGRLRHAAPTGGFFCRRIR